MIHFRNVIRGSWPNRMFIGSLLATLSFLSLLTDHSASAQESIGHGTPQGTWQGEWRSLSTGHRGPMRATITPTARGTYQARFTGRFAAIIPFAYRAELIPQAGPEGQTVLTSYKKLGPILGSYQMQTQVTSNELSGEFQAAKDRGSIRMVRVR